MVLLHQAFAHCGRFLTAASRRNMGRISIPLRLFNLSVQLPIIGLVGFYPTNYLIGDIPISHQPFKGVFNIKEFHLDTYGVLIVFSNSYSPERGMLNIYYSPVRH